MSLTGSDFVLWNPVERRFGSGRGNFTTLKSANEFLSRKVAPEITLLVEELTRYFGHIGMHQVCGDCFAGRELAPIFGDNHYRTWGHHGSWGRPGTGCCAPCTLQGHNACLSKPLGCALWMCMYTRHRFPQAVKVIDQVREVIQKWGDKDYVQIAFFTDLRPARLNARQKRKCLKAIAVLRRAQRTGGQK